MVGEWDEKHTFGVVCIDCGHRATVERTSKQLVKELINSEVHCQKCGSERIAVMAASEPAFTNG